MSGALDVMGTEYATFGCWSKRNLIPFDSAKAIVRLRHLGFSVNQGRWKVIQEIEMFLSLVSQQVPGMGGMGIGLD